MKSRILKLATAVVIITAALIAMLQFNGPLDRAIFARVDSSENNRKCKTLTFKITIPDTSTIIRGMALEPYYIRVVLPGGKIWLLDRRERKVVLMNPTEKTAKIMDTNWEFPDIYDSTRNFKNMPGYSIERIGQRRIGQKQATGFHLTNKKENDQIIVWIDPHSQLPMRIEFFEANELGQMEPKMIWSDIVFDVELDESLFMFALKGCEVEEVDSGCIDGRLNI